MADAPINYVTGPLGSGKSYYAIRKVARGLLAGKVVFGNVELTPQWPEIIARHNPYARFMGRRARREYAIELRTRYFYSPDLSKLTHVKIHGSGEGRALLILDEAHNDLNNRDWQKEESKEFLRWLSLARKKGLHTFILSQHAMNTDAGARRIATVMISLLNWQQLTRVPVFGTNFLPWPFFLAIARLNDDAFDKSMRREKPLYREFFPLGWPRKLYGTHQMFGEIDDDPEAIWLPRPISEVRAELQGINGGVGEKGAGASPRLFANSQRNRKDGRSL